MNRPAREAARQRGAQAEFRAALLLRLKFYRVLARGYRPVRNAGLGEIDIIAARNGVLVLVEVKARDSLADGLEAVSPRQRERIVKAAQSFLKSRPAYRDHGLRFDAMIAVPGRFWPLHIKDAWRP